MVSSESNCAFPPSVVERFWPKVNVGTPDECWEWQASRTGLLRYGQFVPFKGQPKIAHRVSWEIHNGPIPVGLLVCHTCDNPPCVNPAHLFLGTHHDNAEDKVAKGRQSRTGRRRGFGKFTPELKAKATRMREAGHTQTSIADAVGVSQPVISRFLSGRRS